MLFKLRAAWQSVQAFFSSILGERDPDAPDTKTKPKKLGIGGAICMAFRTVGAAIYIATPLLLALPFLVGATWIEAIILVALGLWVGQQFMKFYNGWIVASAWLRAMWHIVRHGRQGLQEVMA